MWGKQESGDMSTREDDGLAKGPGEEQDDDDEDNIGQVPWSNS